MKAFFKLYVILFFACAFHLVDAQPFEIFGKIIDVETKEPIPFANIALKDIYKGTASNILGDFSFKVDSLPIVLVISHLSYEIQEIEVKSGKPITIEMIPGKLLMDELVIKAKGNDEFAYNLVNKAYYKILGKSNTNKYGKAFYRQISRNGDEYSELYEIFYDTKYSNNGVEDWAIQEGRYALKLSTADSFIYNKNFTLMVRLLTIVQPKTDDLIMPISVDVRDQYYLSTDRIISVNNRKVAQIKFTKKEEVTKPAMEGELSIDLDSYEVLKLTGTITNDHLNFITLKGKSGSWKNYQVSCEIAFKKMEDDELALDYMRLGQNFDYYLNNEFVNKVETRSYLTYYEHYIPPSRKKLGGRLLRYNRSDSELLDNIGYNQLFWDENIIVKRTPIEAEVIASFESERAFGSIYLNNKNQIELEDYVLDNDPFIIDARQRLKEFELPRKGQKIYIHHDKPFYISGDKVWFKSYIVNMTNNMPHDQRDVFYLELIAPDGENVLSMAFQVDKGICEGQFTLPKNLNSGVYTLLGRTNWMNNFDNSTNYLEELDIFNIADESGQMYINQEDTVNQFTYHPEGGAFVEGIPNQLAFEAVDAFKNALDIKGKLIDKDGHTVGSLKSEFNGMGSVFVMPKSGADLTTTIMSDDIKEINFPKINSAGYSIMVNNLKPFTIDVTVNGTMKLEGKKFYILLISNGIVYDRRRGMLIRGLFKAEFPKANLPNGIAQLLILDERGIIKCKRLVFVNQPDEAFVKYYLAKKEFKQRERVDLVLEINDENGKPISDANISVSVLDADKISRDPLARNIKNYLNLGFFVDNKLEKQEELFMDDDRETLKKIDFVMLNQQTVYPSFDIGKSIQPPKSKEMVQKKGIVLKGHVNLIHSEKPLSNGILTIISYPNGAKGSWSCKTDNNGRFQLDEFVVTDSVQVLVNAKNSSGKSVTVDVVFDQSDLGSQGKLVKKEIPNDAKRYLDLMSKYQKDVGQEKTFPDQVRSTGNTTLSSDSEKDQVQWLYGFTVSAEFKSPDYSKSIQNGPTPDNRTTIYWNPSVTTNRKGRAKISFYNSDYAKNLQIIIEGLSNEGMPIFDIHQIGKNAKGN